MHIGMFLLGAGFPPDIRVEKEAAALLAAGHKISLLCETNQKHSQALETVAPGIEVHRIAPPPSSALDRLSAALLLREPRYLPAIENFVATVKPDVLHVHDLTFGPTVLKVAQRHGLPLIADLHENMPAAYVAYRAAMPFVKRQLHKLYRNYTWLRWLEARYLRAATQTLVVVPEAAERIRSDYRLPPERLSVVGNSEDAEQVSTGAIDPSVAQKYAGRWVALYTGGHAVHRGLDTAIRGLAHCNVKNVLLVLVGATKEADRRELETLAAEHGVRDKVEIVPWVARDMISSYIAMAQVCLVPHNRFEHTETTIPHKLFQYMALGKPVLVSDCAPLKRVVEQAKCGLVFRANDSQSFGEQLNALAALSEPEKRQLAENGQAAARGDFAWRHDAARLLNVYAGLATFKRQA